MRSLDFVDSFAKVGVMHHLASTINVFAPGLLLVALMSSTRRQGRLAVTWPGLFVGLVGSICIVSAISVVLLELAAFHSWAVQAAAGVINISLGTALAVAFVKNRFSVDLRALRPDRWSVAAGGVILAAMAVRVPVSRYVYGGQDQGTYVIMSRMFDRTGRVTQRCEVVEAIHTDPGLKRARKAYPHLSKESGLRVDGRYEGAVYPGFYIADGDEGVVVPQFFHLHPAWMTVSGWLWSARNGVLSLLLFAFLGLVAIWYLTRWTVGDRWAGRWAGLLALALMGFHILQVWTSRYPLSEIPAQTFVLAGLALLAGSLQRGHHRCSWAMAALGGVSLGLSSFVRITAAFYVAPLLLFFLASPSARKSGGDRYRAFFYTAFLMMGWAAVHNYALSYPYIYDLVRKRLGYRPEQTVGEVAVLAAAGMIGVVLLKEAILEKLLGVHKRRLVRFLKRRAPVVAAVAAVSVAAIMGYELLKSPLYQYRRGHPQQILRAAQLAAFISWPALVAGFVGIAVMAGRRGSPKGGTTLMTLIGVLGLWFFPVVLLWPAYNRYAYYYSRYYVSDLLPLVFMGLSFMAVFLFQKGSGLSTHPRRSRRLAGRCVRVLSPLSAAALLVFFLYGYLTNPTYRRAELTGAWATAEALAAQVPKGSLVVMSKRPEDKPSQNFHVRLGTTLQFAYGKKTLLSYKLDHRWRVLHRLGRPLYLFEESWKPRHDPTARGHLLVPVGGGVIPFNHSEMTFFPPDEHHSSWYFYFLYRLKLHDHDTGEHEADEHETDEHEADEHETDEHEADEHETDEHEADEHEADEHEADEHETDEHGENP